MMTRSELKLIEEVRVGTDDYKLYQAKIIDELCRMTYGNYEIEDLENLEDECVQRLIKLLKPHLIKVRENRRLTDSIVSVIKRGLTK